MLRIMLAGHLVPLNIKYPLEELLPACRRYLTHAPRDFLTFEYCMLDGVNDKEEHAHEIIKWFRNIHLRRGANLI